MGAPSNLQGQDLEKHFNSFLETWMESPIHGFHENFLSNDLECSGIPGDGVAPREEFSAPMPLSFQTHPIPTPFQSTNTATAPFQHSGGNVGSGQAVPGSIGPRGQGSTLSAGDPSSEGVAAQKDCEGTTDPQSKRKTKILEKNRKAQKRFRDKQKVKMSDMEEKVQQLQREMDDMAVEKTCLQRQNEVLQKVLDLRQNQIDTLTEMARIHEEPDEASLHYRQANSMQDGLEPGLQVSDCRTMQNREVLAKWRKYVERMTSLLVEAELPSPSDRCLSELTKVCNEAGNFAQTIALVNPVAIKVLVVSNVETGVWDERRNDPGVWSESIEAMELTTDQKDKILYLASMLFSKISRLGEKRDGIARKLHTLLPTTYGHGRTLGGGIEAIQTMTELRKNFEAEHHSWMNFVASIMAQVLTPLQFARFCSRAYPLFPNTFQIARFLVASGYQPQLPSSEDALAIPSGNSFLAIKEFAENVRL